MRVARKIALASAVIAALTALVISPVSAQTVVSTTGTANYDSSTSGPGGFSLAVGWTEDNAYTNVNISADLQSINAIPDLQGTAYITTAIGPSTPSSDVVGQTVFTYPTTGGAPTTLFSGLSLDANTTYYLVINSNTASGSPIWWGDSNGATVTTAPGVTYLGGYLGSNSVVNTYDSNFSNANSGGAWPNQLFSVTGDPVSVVPEPSSLAPFAAIGAFIGGLLLVSRRRKSTQFRA